MKKAILISAVCAASLQASEVELGKIEVKEEINTKTYNNISGSEVKSADLAEALSKKSSSITLIRRSGIANDIVLRGQKRDNIRVTIDDGFVCGACPNRMDPPTSHVITTNIENVIVKEGPFDVTELGTLSGGVKIKTKAPQKEIGGDINVNMGSFGYKKFSASVTGGNDTVQVLAVVSKEESDQYEDGDGNTMAEQTKNIVDGTANSTTQYASNYDELKAFEKQSIMVKTNVNINDAQNLSLSVTKNESDNILYPSTGMDAIYDDSDIVNAKYTALDLGEYSKKLEVKVYKSEVDHPMSTMYRQKGSVTEMTNHLTTDVQGLKIENTLNIFDRELLIGVDSSNRNWDGHYSISGAKNNPMVAYSINDTDTKNNALFVQCNRNIADLELEVGVRYDKTKVDTAGTEQDNDYSSLSASLFATYNKNDSTKYFFGIGKASRVPDARELYFVGKTTTGTVSIGTEDLKQTTNKEIDLGVEKYYEKVDLKAKLFYSLLTDYIYYKKTMAADRFVNIDAKIYGMELSGTYYINDALTLDGEMTYKKGQKDEAITAQSDKDLADITPMKTQLALNYDHDRSLSFSAELIHSAKWSSYDSDNGEQAIDAYNVINIKANKTYENFEITVGIDNLLDETYAVSNTYADLTLLSDGTDVMLLNEPGRYVYTNIRYKF
jgi:iron complex outermembrane receptor protein